MPVQHRLIVAGFGSGARAVAGQGEAVRDPTVPQGVDRPLLDPRRLTRSDLDDLVVGNILEKSIAEISKSDQAWNVIKGFYAGKRPETCLECTFYQPIDRPWLERRAAGQPALPAEKPAAPANS